MATEIELKKLLENEGLIHGIQIHSEAMDFEGALERLGVGKKEIDNLVDREFLTFGIQGLFGQQNTDVRLEHLRRIVSKFDALGPEGQAAFIATVEAGLQKRVDNGDSSTAEETLEQFRTFVNKAETPAPTAAVTSVAVGARLLENEALMNIIEANSDAMDFEPVFVKYDLNIYEGLERDLLGSVRDIYGDIYKENLKTIVKAISEAPAEAQEEFLDEVKRGLEEKGAIEALEMLTSFREEPAPSAITPAAETPASVTASTTVYPEQQVLEIINKLQERGVDEAAYLAETIEVNGITFTREAALMEALKTNQGIEKPYEQVTPEEMANLKTALEEKLEEKLLDEKQALGQDLVAKIEAAKLMTASPEDQAEVDKLLQRYEMAGAIDDGMVDRIERLTLLDQLIEKVQEAHGLETNAQREEAARLAAEEAAKDADFAEKLEQVKALEGADGKIHIEQPDLVQMLEALNLAIDKYGEEGALTDQQELLVMTAVHYTTDHELTDRSVLTKDVLKEAQSQIEDGILAYAEHERVQKEQQAKEEAERQAAEQAAIQAKIDAEDALQDAIEQRALEAREHSQEVFTSAELLVSLQDESFVMDRIDGGKVGDGTAKGEAKETRLENIGEYQNEIARLMKDGNLDDVVEKMREMGADEDVLERIQGIAHLMEMKEAVLGHSNLTAEQKVRYEELRAEVAEKYGDGNAASFSRRIQNDIEGAIQNNFDHLSKTRVDTEFTVSEEQAERIEKKHVTEENDVKITKGADGEYHVTVGGKRISGPDGEFQEVVNKPYSEDLTQEKAPEQDVTETQTVGVKTGM